MTDERIQEIAKENYWNSDASGSLTSKQCYTLGFVDGAKELAKELAKENELLAKRICELQSDLSREKSTVEELRRCSNCNHYNRIYELCHFSLGDEDYDCRNRKWELAE